MKAHGVAIAGLCAWGVLHPAVLLAESGSPSFPVRINEVMFRPAVGQSEWVELRNTAAAAISLRGYVLGDGDGNAYGLPAGLPDVPAGAFVLVYFDGAGSAADDLDFSDNVAVLHSPSGLVNIFEDAADQVGLYDPSTGFTRRLYLALLNRKYAPYNPPLPNPFPSLPPHTVVDFVAWGAEPGSDAAEAERSGVWRAGWYVSTYRSLGEASPEVLAGPGEPIGRVQDSTTAGPDAWLLYRAFESTPGAQNALAGVSWSYPPDGALIASTTFAVGWMPIPGATGYQFQLDDASDFASPSVDTLLGDASYVSAASVAPGTYYWRVRPAYASGNGPWTAPAQIQVVALPGLARPSAPGGVNASKTLGIAWQLQHKDTQMLCLDGDAETGDNPWDAPHATRGTHANQYCARASVAMLASYYGGKLSQDRITFEIFKGGAPEGDLGHDTPNFLNQTDASVAWAIGTPITRTMGKPTFAQIKGWIDANQPLIASIPSHVRVIDGYWEFSLGEFTFELLHVLNPWDAPVWVGYAADPISSYFVGPAGANGAPNVKSDEDVDHDNIADTVDDSDGDGLSDFDERNRFSTDPTKPDTDADLVPDKLDVRGYVFLTDGTFSPLAADLDGDGKRKELDKDNDSATNDAAMDGCEDTNRNGKFDPAETSNYDPKDDIGIQIRLDWPLRGADVDLHLIRPGGSMNSYGDCYYGNTNPDWGAPGSSCDDPRLDADCITGCTVENIRLGSPVTGTYSIKVHYYSDHGDGATSPNVTVWVKGVPRLTASRSLSNDQIWDVGTIEWPSAAIRLTDTLREPTPDERAADSTKSR